MSVSYKDRLSEPVSLGFFSVDRDQSVRCDGSNAKYLNDDRIEHSTVNINLNAGYHLYKNWVVKLCTEEVHKKGCCYWDFNKCMNYLHSTLTDVRACMKVNKACIVEKSSDSATVTKKYTSSTADLNFIPEDFKKRFNLK